MCLQERKRSGDLRRSRQEIVGFVALISACAVVYEGRGSVLTAMVSECASWKERCPSRTEGRPASQRRSVELAGCAELSSRFLRRVRGVCILEEEACGSDGDQERGRKRGGEERGRPRRDSGQSEVIEKKRRGQGLR